MDFITSQKQEIEEKLRRDSEVVKTLTESLQQSEQNTQSMVQILDSMQARLRRLETTIIPVYKQTLEQTQMQKNVDAALSSLNRVISFHSLTKKLDQKIRDGPSTDLEDYINCLEKLRDACEYFNVYNPDNGIEVSNLFDQGCELLIREFRVILQKNTQPVRESTLLDLTSTADDVPPMEHLSPRSMYQLQIITQYLVNKCSNTDFMNVYFQVRSGNLVKSLSTIRESDKGSKLANDSGKAESLRLHIRNQTPRRVSKRAVNLVNSSATRAKGSEADHNEQVDNVTGTANFQWMASIFLRLIESEYNLMKNIIPEQYHTTILDKLVEKALEVFLSEYDSIYNRAKNNLQKKDFLIASPLLSTISHMHKLIPSYESVLEYTISKGHIRIQQITDKCEELALRLIDEFISEINAIPCRITNVPKDSTVHEITSQTMSFLENLLHFTDTFGRLWVSREPVLSNIQDQTVLAERGMAKCQLKILNTLCVKLEGQASCYENITPRSIFLMNNYHFIRKTLTLNSFMMTIIENDSPDLEDKYNEKIGKQRKSYFASSFGKLMNHISDPERPLVTGEKMSAQLKQSIKDRFKGFNTEIEEITRIQKTLSIPDKDLRDSIKSDNIDFVKGLYQGFYDSYADTNFTKNRPKYVKYNPEAVDEFMKSLFDSTN